MGVLTSQVIAGLLQMHGPDATIQSDHRGIDALLNGLRGHLLQNADNMNTTDGIDATQVVFRRGGFVRGPGGAGAFRRGAAGAGGFRRGAFRRV